MTGVDPTKRTVRPMRGRKRLRAALVVSAVAVLVISGCGTQKAGSAAVAGDERLTETQLGDLYDELDVLYAANPDTPILPQDQLTLSVISWWVNEQLIGAVADAQGLTATQAQIDEVLGADQKARDAISLSNGIPPSRLAAAAEVFVLSSALTDSLTKPGASKEETNAVLVALLQQTAEDLGISVNPRFGTWNTDTVSVEPRNPERLSSPAGGMAKPPALDVPSQG